MTDAQRFRDLYEECQPRVLAYAASLVGRQVGEDITSETFTVAWRRMRDIPTPPLPWLLGVARNLTRELRRHDGRQYALAAQEAQRVITSGAQVEDVAAGVTERAVALQALAGLSAADRELLTLVAWHGLGPRQAARVLGCSGATFAVRLHRARRRLERAVDAVGPSPGPEPEPGPGPEPGLDPRPRAPRANVTVKET
ncbi:RNA polymerase sigma factor [Streptomyces violaceusniger]|uniref:RNA polymerase, sigma-24 subunit, ECF subfamily n=1 Tax=Streptomyces violaceusniger (strain Tu 4113) TaxID=653045 RepID=G2NWP4_STRV4|nr:sigma-70 family RNA polymerase sigma factor [Streptomyces violaceusniger]AEM87001.1 RNA polymerase, sigma-24 subunit, ECF subfamily [Streptomyces violaceusniger Tu 4113]